VSTVVDGPAARDIASRVTGGEVMPLTSRAMWLATGPGGASPVSTVGLQVGTAGVVTAGLLGGAHQHQAGGRGAARWPAPLVVAGEPAPAPATHNPTIPPERIQHTQLKESLRAVFAGDRDSTDTSVMVDRWCSTAQWSRISQFVTTGRTTRKHRNGIDATIDRGLSNGRQEGLNNKTRLIIRSAYDFHSPEAALATVMLTRGPVNLEIPSTPPPLTCRAAELNKSRCP